MTRRSWTQDAKSERESDGSEMNVCQLGLDTEWCCGGYVGLSPVCRLPRDMDAWVLTMTLHLLLTPRGVTSKPSYHIV